MRKQAAITAAVTAVVLVAAACWHLKKDDRPVDKIAEPQSSTKRFVLPELFESKQNANTISAGESLVPAEYKPNASSIGVPWNVERAMMGDAQSNGAPLRESNLSDPQPVSPMSIRQPQTDSILGTPATPPDSK